jgi:tetratricopeptide (TPR) repeat protein
MDKVSHIDINQKPRAGRNPQTPGGRGIVDIISRVLVFFILLLVFLLGRHLVFNNGNVPRTSLERDIMDNASRLESNPKDAVAHAGLGAAYIKMDKIDDAVAEFKAAVRIKPESAQYRFNLAMAYEDRGDTEKALRELNEAKGLARDWDAPYFSTGLINLTQKKYDEAIRDFRECLGRNPGNADAHFKLGEAYAALGKKDKAATHYNEVLKYVPDYEDAKTALKKLGER